MNAEEDLRSTRSGDPTRPRFGDTTPREDAGTTESSRSRTVLVVDDQDVVRDVICIALEGAGYTVLAAGSPNAALDLVRGGGESIDLLVTDVVMPEMDAFELADRIACEVPGVRILYTSGYTDAGAEGPFIQKPFNQAQLIEKVRDVLAGAAT
jgi:two-component system, cell cycle sensor histidine kinase and response regulator CckA